MGLFGLERCNDLQMLQVPSQVVRSYMTNFFTTSTLIFIVFFSGTLKATELTAQEKLDFIRGSVAPCISKNSVGKTLTNSELSVIKTYCTCHGSTMASITTREELAQMSKGSIPSSFSNKVVQARESCISSMSN
jgi:hypothetical protein